MEDLMWLPPRVAAEKYGVHPKTLARWADEGLIHAIMTPGGHRRYDPKTLDAAMTDPTAQTQIDLAAIRATLRKAA
jgi:DNA-binding transcriptional MerR regulator